MEKDFKIEMKDGKKLEGILRGSLNNPLILLVHGLCGHMNQTIFYDASRYFSKKGFSSFRFNLYSATDGCRKLQDCDLKIHGSDISDVLNFFKTFGFGAIFIVGHSYGFPSLLHADLSNIKGMVSWDGTVLPRKSFNNLPAIDLPFRARFFDAGGYYALMGEEMAKEERDIDTLKLINHHKKPVKFISVDGKGNAKDINKIFNEIRGSKSFDIVMDANHDFDREGNQDELYKRTVDWLIQSI